MITRNSKTLILTRKDVAQLVDMKGAIKAVEEAFGEYGLGRVKMPPKIYLDLPELGGDFRAMPSYVRKFNLSTLKWVNAHPQNVVFGLPSVMAVVIVNDPKTGFPLAIMDGTLATSLRTGAGGAVAAKYLARAELTGFGTPTPSRCARFMAATKDSSVVALVGCGVQARSQLMALREILKIKAVRVWGHQSVLVKEFIRDMKKKDEIMTVAATVREGVKEADIVVTTTPSRRPIVQSVWIKEGTHINAIGADAPGKQELDPEILKRAKVVVDDWYQASHSGEINVPISKGILKRRDIYTTLGEIVAGKKKGRMSAQEVTVFDSTGLAIQDTAIASLIYKAAVKKRVGVWMKIV